MGEPRTRLKLRVVPGHGRSEVIGRYGEAWKVRVGAAPERGRANAELLRLLSERLGVRLTELTIVSGLTARDKVVGNTAPPASTLVVVAALANAAWVVEIECVAAKG